MTRLNLGIPYLVTQVIVYASLLWLLDRYDAGKLVYFFVFANAGTFFGMLWIEANRYLEETWNS